MTTPPPNPFSDWQIGRIEPGADIPLPVLLQGAIGGTVDDDGITEHALHLFAVLDVRGPDEWRHAALLLIQFLLSGGHYGSGDAAAHAYIASQPEAAEVTPGLALVHAAMAAYIRGGEDSAADVLVDPPNTANVPAATRFLFCLAAGSSGLAPGTAVFDRLLSVLCGTDQ